MTDVVVSSEDVIIEVAQPTTPPGAPPPKIGLVEINQVVARGTAWLTGQGPPTMAGGQYGDMYLDANTGDMYQWDGTKWKYIGTFAPSTDTPAEVLAKLLTVDGAGSALDADLLDGQHGAYYAKQTDLDINNNHDTTQDGQLSSLSSNVGSNTSAISALQASDTTQNSRLTAVEGVNTTQDTHLSTIDADQITQNNRLTAVENKNTTQDTAINGKEPSIAAGNPLYFWAGDKSWKPVPPAGVPEAPNDGTQYVRQSLSWQPVVVPPGTYVADSPPPSPSPNQLWWKSNLGQLFIYYLDPGGAPAQWVQAAGSATGQVRNTARSRNRVNNPTAQVSQENGGTAVTTSGSYPADQWYLNVSGIVSSAQKQTYVNLSPEGTNTGLYFMATTAKGSLAATDILSMYSPIEGLDVADLAWGTASAKPAVLRFAAMCDQTGTFGFSIANRPTVDRCYLGSFTIAAASQWQVFSFAIPADTTGTWLKDTGVGMMIRFSYALGTSYTGVAGWQAGNLFAPPGCTNGAAVANSVMRITDVGLYADPDGTGLPPPFVAPPFADDLARCRRYYNKLTNRWVVSGYGAASQTIFAQYGFPVQMRAIPSANSTSSGLVNTTGLSLSATGTDSVEARCAATAQGLATAVADAMIFSARLI